MQTETKVHPPDEQHILLTSLGRHAIETEYKWQGDRKITASLTPLALVQFLKAAERPNRVVTLVTEAAEQDTWPIFQEGILEVLGVTPERVEISIGSPDDEIREILADVAE